MGEFLAALSSLSRAHLLQGYCILLMFSELMSVHMPLQMLFVARTCGFSRSCATAWLRCCACWPMTQAVQRCQSCCGQVQRMLLTCIADRAMMKPDLAP